MLFFGLLLEPRLVDRVAAGNGTGWHVVGALVSVATRNASAVVAAHVAKRLNPI